MRWASGLNVLLGAWLALSPLVFGTAWATTGSVVNAIFIGILVGMLGVIRATGAYGAAWMSVLTALLGLWVFVSPWVHFYAWNEPRAWNSLFVGGAIATLGVISAVATYKSGRRGLPGPRPEFPSYAPRPSR